MAGRGISFVFLLAVLLAMNCKWGVTSNSKISTMAEKFQDLVNMYYKTHNETMDVVFVLDQSSSVGKDNFQKLLSFMKSALSELSVAEEHTRVSVIRFGSGVTVDVRMDQNLDKCALFEEIEERVKYEGGLTNTEGGLKEAKRQLANSRNGAVRLVITVTDGEHTIGADPKSIASEMKNDEIIMIAFGIGYINYAKLADIASNARWFVNNVDGFTQFKELAEVIYKTPDSKFFKEVGNDKCNSRCNGQGFCGCESFGGGSYQCACPPGYHRSGYSCEECPLGEYKETNSTSSSCTACPEHMVTKQKGSTNKSSCDCIKGFKPSYRNGERICEEHFCKELKATKYDHWRIVGHCNRRYLDSCEFICNHGYVTNDTLNTQCKENRWSNFSPTCKAITCGLPPQVKGTKHYNCINTKGGLLSIYNYGAVCNYSVNYGYRLTGDNKIECKIDGKWYGNVQTTLITCPVLQGIRNGLLANPLCSDPKRQRTLDLVCTYHCNKGYRLNGVYKRHCREDGTWQPTSNVTFCKDIEPPTITTQCPQNIYVETNRSMPTASVKWNEPVAEDNSKVTPQKTIRMIFQSQEQLIQKLKIPHKFKIGKTRVEYTFTDGERLTSVCHFDVFVEDNERPMVDFCPEDQTIITQKRWTNASWIEPKFKDNSGNFSLEKNRDLTLVYWGKYEIIYTATDKSKNAATCTFTVSVQPNKCPYLDPPINGAQSCDMWLLGKFCTIHCDERFEFSEKPEPLYVCGASGKWSPPGSTPWPNCLKVYNPKIARVGLKTGHYYKGDCNNKTVQREIKKKFIQIFSKTLYGKFAGGCTGNKECKVENVIVRCGKKNLTILAASGNRKKRDIEDFPIIIEFYFIASLNVESAKVNQFESQQLKKSLTGVLEIKQTMENDSKELNDGQIIDVEVEKEAEFRCEFGQFMKNGSKCADCPVGTYQIQLTTDQETPKDCIPCPKGSFNNLEAQLSCTKCPLNKTTHKTGAKNESYCLSPCSPGSFSTTGLETCVSCPEGQFQNVSAQITCKQCPQGTTTPQRGAVYERDCQVECVPGSSSDTGLTPCSPCEKNTYQPKSRQRNCLRCPYPNITLSDGATSLEHCIDVNECLSGPCQNGATCLDDQGFYTCTCRAGFTGVNCETNIDDCEVNPCQNGATCTDLIDSFQCTCLAGYNGSRCEGQINDCYPYPCLNGGTCRDYINNYTCDCHIGYSGLNCEVNINDCDPNPCNHSAPCTDLVNNFICSCPVGFTGKRCEIDIDECDGKDCQHNGGCTDLVNDFKCECKPGYSGRFCEIDINECASSPCLNNATCLDDVNDYYCGCLPNFSGKKCEIVVSNNFDIDFTNASISDYISLEPRPPFPNMEAITVGFWMFSTDNSTFHNYGTPFSYGTKNHPNNFTLFNYGYFALIVNGKKVVTGVETNDGVWHHVLVTWQMNNGEWKIYKDGILEANGTGLSTGVPVPGGGKFVVGQNQIRNGDFLESETFRGRISQLNLWKQVLQPHQVAVVAKRCVREHPGVLKSWADVKRGLVGKLRESAPSEISSDAAYCKDIDECQSNKGGCSHICHNHPWSYSCSCNRGYKLNADKHGCTDIDECQSKNGGCFHRCNNHPGSYSCSCFPGYKLNSDKHGCTDIDECQSNNGGCSHRCHNHPGSYSCSCNRGYKLTADKHGCTDIDECQSNNGGCSHICHNHPGSYSCSCNRGYKLNADKHGCTDIDECQSSKGGCSHTCHNHPGSYLCSCNRGYKLNADKHRCTDIDECKSGSGGCSHRCQNLQGSFVCSCNRGYKLNADKHQCNDIDECQSNKGGCSHTCQNHPGNYSCSCNRGYKLNADKHGCTDFNQCNGKPKNITAASGILTSPKHPSHYSHNMFCVWRITVPRGKTLRLTFASFRLESHSKCVYDYLKLQNGLTYGSPFLGKYCGSNLPPTRYANTGSMLLTFKSDSSVSYNGFKAVFTSVSSTYSGCSSTPLEITGAKGNIKSPNYPSEYSNNLNCTWRITSPEGMRLKLIFDLFHLESETDCSYDYVELRDGLSLQGKYCGETVPPEKIAESGTMQVTFVSDGSISHSGFIASYSAVPLGNDACNGSPKEITASNGVLTSPNFPNNYNHNQRCVWKLKVPDGKIVQLAFTSFALEGSSCSYDYVEVRSGWTTTSSLLGKFCGQSTPPTLYSNGRTMMVTFSSDGSAAYEGFHAVFTAVLTGG